MTFTIGDPLAGWQDEAWEFHQSVLQPAIRAYVQKWHALEEMVYIGVLARHPWTWSAIGLAEFFKRKKGS